MYVILTQDVPQVGTKNALVQVSDGYFMNYLSPRKLATTASTEMIEQLKDKILEQKEASEQAAKTAEEQVQTLQTTTVVVTGKASGKGTLFKAISEKDIAKAIKEKTSIVVDPSQITMEHFKKKGDYTVSISLSGRKATVPVRVESKA